MTGQTVVIQTRSRCVGRFHLLLAQGQGFVRRLDEELQARERKAWVDWEGIRPAEEFMQAIFRAIEGTDTFVFVLTPDSVTSEVCGREIAHAAVQNKRMVPIIARDVAAKEFHKRSPS